jgi:hypothetical protein
VKTHIFLCLLSQVVLGWTRRELKECNWLGSEKERTIEGFINLLSSIKCGKFVDGKEEIFIVQSKNPLKKVLSDVLGINSFVFMRDKKACSL